MSGSIPRLSAANCVLVVVDIQDKLLAAMPAAQSLVKNVSFLLDVANLLAIPAIATEQYPKGLGPTTPEIAKRLSREILSKTSFSCCHNEEFLKQLKALGRKNIILAGMETHVCVSQTAFDLLDAGVNVFLPVDAVSSRFEIDHQTAFQRLTQHGCTLTTAEAIAFEWLGDAAHPSFKSVSKLVIERSKST